MWLCPLACAVLEPPPPDLLCAPQVGWQAQMPIADGNGMAPESAAGICCADAALEAAQAYGSGSAYLCCALPNAFGGAPSAGASCAPSQLVQQVSPESTYSDGSVSIIYVD